MTKDKKDKTNILLSSAQQQTRFLPLDPRIQFVTLGLMALGDKLDPWICRQKSSLSPRRNQDICHIDTNRDAT